MYTLSTVVFLFLLAGPGQLVQASTCRDLLGDYVATSSREFLPDEPFDRSVYRMAATSKFGSLYYSPQAEYKSRNLDDFLAHLETVAEVGAIGLTRTKGNDLLIEDLVLPSKDKIFIIEGFFILKEVRAFGDALGSSSTLNLTKGPAGLMIKSNNSQYDIDARPAVWNAMSPYIAKACGCQLPQTYEATVARIEAQGAIPITTDWDLVITGASTFLTDSYLSRVQGIASDMKLGMKFNMHHHPRYNLAVELISKQPAQERQKYFTKLLTPSVSDLFSMDELGADWFEIRSLGTVDNVSARETSVRFFDMREVREKKDHIVLLLRSLIAVPRDASTLELQQLRLNVHQFTDWAADRNLSTRNLIEYAFDADEFKKLKARTDSLSGSSHEPDTLIIQLMQPN